MPDARTLRDRLAARGTSFGTECLAGVTTFVTLSYILFVQPAMLAAAGIPFETGLFATCVASAVACVVMAVLADYPIALAPAMGHNSFFAFHVCGAAAAGGLALTWQQGLAAVFLASAAFLLLSLTRVREIVFDAIPSSLKHAIAGGIGLLIGFLGLQWAGIVVARPVTLVGLGDLSTRPTLLALGGLLVTAVLASLRVRGATLIGLLLTALAGMAVDVVPIPDRIAGTIASPRLALLDLDFAGLFASPRAAEVILVFFFLMLFDTIGTLAGVASRGGFLVDGKLPRVGRALLADATGTVVGAALGTSTITSYVESAAGVQAGGRTGLANLVTAALLLLALPFQPLIAVIGEGVRAGPGGLAEGSAILHPVLAPCLIVVGALMARSAAEIDWDDAGVAIPCFVALLAIPLTLSITEGIAFGVVGISVIALVTGRARRVHWILHLMAAAFLARWGLL